VASWTALRDATFDVNTGELFAVIGPNGAGKTSIFNCLNGVYRPSRDHQLQRHGDHRQEARRDRQARMAAHVPEPRTVRSSQRDRQPDVGAPRAYAHRVRRGMAWLGLAQREEVEHRRRCEEIMELLALQPYRYEPVGMLPYGVQKRIEVGRALAMDRRCSCSTSRSQGMNLNETEDMAAHISSRFAASSGSR